MQKAFLPPLLIALILWSMPTHRQDRDTRKMAFQLGLHQNELAVNVEYQDPSSVDRRLKGSRVLPVHLEIRNVSQQTVKINSNDIGLNLNGNRMLSPAGEHEVVAEMNRTGQHPLLLNRFFTDQSSAFHGKFYPHLEERLKEVGFKHGDIEPGKSRDGFIFFIRPPETDSTTFNGVMWLEWPGPSDYAPQILDTKGIRVVTKAPSQASFTARLREIWNQYFTGETPTYNKSYAFLVGIGQYKHVTAISSPAQDVKKMEAFLNEQGFDEIVTVTDENVTADTVHFPQNYFKGKIYGDDRFLFYYSGHGVSRLEDGRTRGYLPLVDEKPLGRNQSIPMDTLVLWMKNLPAKHLLVILDACFSGLAVEGIEMHSANPGDMRADPEILRTLSRERAQFLLMAGTERQESFGDRRWNGSLFTDTLIKGLRKDADLLHNRIVTTRELYVWLQLAVNNEARKVNRELTPLIKDLSPTGVSKGDFIFLQ